MEWVLTCARMDKIVGDIQMVLKQFRKWEVGHVGREGNQAAHIFTKAAVQEFRETIWLEEIPSIIQHVVLLELSSLLSVIIELFMLLFLDLCL